MSWQVGMAANAVIAVAYFLIALAIIVPLARSQQLRTNPLGAATAAIFFTCAVHHGTHSVHMLLPSFGTDDSQRLAMREAWGWPLATWDVVGAVVAAYYWSLRRNYSSLMQGAKLFDDLRQREQQALGASIDSASRMITELLGSEHYSLKLLRSAPAAVATETGPEPEEQT